MWLRRLPHVKTYVQQIVKILQMGMYEGTELLTRKDVHLTNVEISNHISVGHEIAKAGVDKVYNPT